MFNGNGYSEEWAKEAQRRGLSNLNTTAKALPTYISDKNIDLVTRHGIYTEAEFRARYEIHLESYVKLIRIESKSMVDMSLHQILPAAMRYSSDLAKAVLRKKELGINAKAESDLTRRLSETIDSLYEKTEQLVKNIKAIPSENLEATNYCSEVLVSGMKALRKDADLLEKLTDKSYWPYPIYSDILFY
jgi:glutamine synthetase